MHDANGEGFSLVAVEVRERPLGRQFGRNSSDDFDIARRQTCVRVVVPNNVAVSVQDHVVLLGQVVPRDFLVAAGDLANAVVGGRVPLHLLPSTADAKVLNEGQRSPSRSVRAVPVVTQAGEVGGRGQVAEQTTEDGEGDRRVADAVVEQAAVPIRRVVRLEVKPERLLVAAEIGPSRVINGHVGFSTHEVGLRFVAVEHEHLRDFGIHSVSGVVADGQVLGVEELSDAEVARCIGQNVDGFDGSGVVGGPLNVHLHGELRRSLNDAGDGIQPVNMTGEDGGALRVQPEVVGQVQRDVGRSLVVCVKDAVVVVVPIRGQIGVLNDVEIRVGSSVVVVVGVNDVGAGGRVRWVGDAFAVAKVVVVPRVG